MTVFEHAVDIPVAPVAVFRVMADVERWHEWTASVKGVRLFGRPLGVGSRALIRQPKFPPALWTVTDLVPGREFIWVSTAPGLRVVARHGVEASPGGTRAVLRLTYDGWLGDWFARLTRDITERYLALEANGLKARSLQQR